MSVLDGMTTDEANAFVRASVDPAAHAAILAGSFTIQDTLTWRKSVEISQIRLSYLLGYSPRQIRAIEKGEDAPSLRYLKAWRNLARKVERGLFTSETIDDYDLHTYAYIPREEVAGRGAVLRKCANPKCYKEVYMLRGRRYCSNKCRDYVARKGLTDATYQDEPQRVPRRPKSGPVTACCPNCGHHFPIKGHAQRQSLYESHGGRAHLPEG